MKIHKDIINRYDQLILNYNPDTPIQQAPEKPLWDGHLRWMLDEIRNENVVDDKSHRWLGYIQGILAVDGRLKVKEERDFTRPYFTATNKE